MIIKILEFFISKIKKREFKLDELIGFDSIFRIMLSKFLRLFRGILFSQRFIYIGKSSSLICKKKFISKSNNIEIGDFCIIDCLSKKGISIGSNFKLGDFSRIIASGTLRDIGIGIEIGNNVAIGEYSYIGGAGGVTIGSDCIVGQYLSIHPENHIFSNLETKIRDQGVSRKGINIGNNCWIGAKVTICDGVTIGDGCVVAAGSVVTKSFQPNAVIGGVPAKLLRLRNE